VEERLGARGEGRVVLGVAPLELGALVDYQTSSIVSRTLVKGPGGTITAFAFDAGQALSEHTAPFDAVAQVIDGEADITIAGTTYRVATGQLIVMPANQPHAVSAGTRFKMLLTMIR
jgi:quercetin dioxygenase-like cupin family protein